MNIEELKINGLKLITPDVFNDTRGYFFESYNKKKYMDLGITCEFVQDNQSYSKYGTLRGLHFQVGEFAQAKLVRVLQGEVLDVAVDLRPNSPTFGKHASVLLSEENKKQLFVPRGFAHGFVVLSSEAVFHYKCDNFYNKNAERGIIYNDPHLAIDWKLKDSEVQLSVKDSQNLTFERIKSEL